MNEFSDTEIWLAVVLAFGAGYFLVSFLARLMKTEPPASPGKMNPPSSTLRYDPIALQQDRCAQVLGVRPGASEIEIEQAYRQLLAKYDPAKITDLGDEFRQLANQKLEDIEEAYAILKQARSVN
jgi:DnaJ-domain-containing protein 1